MCGLIRYDVVWHGVTWRGLVCCAVGGCTVSRTTSVTGVLERPDTMTQFKVLQQVKPSLKHVVIIGDNSTNALCCTSWLSALGMVQE